MSDSTTPRTVQYADATDTEAETSAPMASSAVQVVGDLSTAGQAVENLYYTLLNRPADPASLAADEAELPEIGPNSGIVDLSVELGISGSLIKSAEYHALHGHQSNAQFVRSLFEGAFGRAADAASLATDVRHLAHGLSRQALAVSIAESPEAFSHLGSKPV